VPSGRSGRARTGPELTPRVTDARDPCVRTRSAETARPKGTPETLKKRTTQA